MLSSPDPPRLIPPTGINFSCVDQVSIDELARALQTIAVFLQELDPDAQLLRFRDWWQHDGLHFYDGETDWRGVYALVEAPRWLLAAMPGDDYVRVGVAPNDSSWYLRFYVDWTENGWALRGDFDITVPYDLASAFREGVVPNLGVPVIEQNAEDWYRRIILYA